MFAYTDEFNEKWSKLNLTDSDLNELENFLLKNPSAGKVIKGTGSLRKLRWALPNMGKSGGIRVLYVDIVLEELFMVTLFAKKEKDDLTEVEKKAIKIFISNEIKKRS
jgi:hypothetical protein